MKKHQDLLVSLAALVFSVVVGILSGDLVLGGAILFTSLVCAYFAGNGKRANYVFGLINYLLMAYVCFVNGLYRLFFFNLLVFAPLQFRGFVSWGKKLTRKNTVKVRKFTFKNSVVIVSACIAGSFGLGFLLSLIPGQQLAFFDASSNCINLCGIVLMIMRFREAWFVWLANNIIDLIIWIIIFANRGQNSLMMLLSAVAFLVINVWGIYKWGKKARYEKRRKNKC